jgi:hypothetical protein
MPLLCEVTLPAKALAAGPDAAATAADALVGVLLLLLLEVCL